jgi:voltage-gated sodium channel
MERRILKHKLDIVLGLDLGDEKDADPFLESLKQFAKRAAAVEENPYFVNLITLTILAVAIQIGIDTDDFMSCGRATLHGRWKPSCDASTFNTVMTGLSQAIFTAEMCTKLAAKGACPEKYFEDPWNRLDSFVVTVGFVEMTPAFVIFEAFPVVVLRLLRLLRVFRLAKAFPRLRSIVEALMQGFGAVGWIVVLMLVFNYIWGCICMLFMGANDPFHFGYVASLRHLKSAQIM